MNGACQGDGGLSLFIVKGPLVFENDSGTDISGPCNATDPDTSAGCIAVDSSTEKEICVLNIRTDSHKGKELILSPLKAVSAREQKEERALKLRNKFVGDI